MKKITLLFIIILFMGCANKANIVFQTWPYSKYKVEYEKGLVLMNEDVIKTVLKFERKTLARFFLTDTYQALNIYILSNKFAIKDEYILIENPKIFYIMSKMYTSCGDMDINSIIIHKNKGKLFFSGNLVSNNSIKG
jgi:hypothetical protein